MSTSVHIEQNGQLYEMPIDERAFRVDDSNLDVELSRIGSLIFEYGTIEAETKLRVGRLDSELERMRSELDAKVREDFLALGEKATEAKVASKVTLNPAFQEVVFALNQANRDAAILKWAMTALVHKSEALRALAYRENQSIKADRR